MSVTPTLFPSSDAKLGAARLSDCGQYRYTLTREWDASKPTVAFCMLNPSTADAEQDDPTIRRCIGFAKAWGCGGLVVVNLFALRATDPAELYRHPSPVAEAGEHSLLENLNDAWLLNATDGMWLIAAWGVHGGHLDRDRRVMKLFARWNRKLECLGTTKEGFPKHPLYLAADTVPVPYHGRPHA